MNRSRGEYFAEKLYLFRSQVQKILSFPIIGSFQFLQMNGPFWFLKYSTRANKCYSWLVASPLVFMLKCNFYMLFMRYNQCPKKNFWIIGAPFICVATVSTTFTKKYSFACYELEIQKQVGTLKVCLIESTRCDRDLFATNKYPHLNL